MEVSASVDKFNGKPEKKNWWKKNLKKRQYSCLHLSFSFKFAPVKIRETCLERSPHCFLNTRAWHQHQTVVYLREIILKKKCPYFSHLLHGTSFFLKSLFFFMLTACYGLLRPGTEKLTALHYCMHYVLVHENDVALQEWLRQHWVDSKVGKYFNM